MRWRRASVRYPALQPAAVVQKLRRLRVLGPQVRPRYSLPDLIAVALAAAVVALWVQAAGGGFSLRALLACEAVFLAFYLTGCLFAGWRGLAAGVLFDLPLRLLCGYAAVNTALFALAWLSPLGILANFGLVLAVVVSLFLAAGPAREQSRGPSATTTSDQGVGLLVLGLSLVAATLWCQDSLRPMVQQGDTVVFEPWIDGFYHAVHIRIFGASHGGATIEDFRLAGVPARLYHYGIYLTPALVKQAAGIPSYTAFAGLLAPLGVVFTGLAAYALVGSWWGRWPGLAASAALLLLPDGAQQGMRNTFMSYRWLTQISPSATFGVSLLAVAWLFVLRGCTQGSRLQVLAGWLVGGLLVFYKAHFFIASALLLLLVPPVFFRAALGPRKRILWAAVAATACFAAVAWMRKVPGVPLLRLDGSGFRDLLGHIVKFTEPGAVRGLVAERVGLDHGALANLVVGAPFVLLAALGLFLPLLLVLAIRLRRRAPAVLVVFPLVLVGNFLVMFLGLALDLDSSTPDELSHRPVILVYFFVVAWVGGAAALSWLESERLGRRARPVIIGLSVVLMAVPAYFGAGIHRMWAMRSISPPLPVPLGLVRAAEFIRDHADPQDLVQDSRLDRTSVLTALSERQAFAGRALTRMPHNADRVEQRAGAMERLMAQREPRVVAATAKVFGVRWFLLNPGDQVAWAEALASRPAFALDGYRVYRLF